MLRNCKITFIAAPSDEWLLVVVAVATLHLLTLWPWHLTFWPRIKKGDQDLCCTKFGDEKSSGFCLRVLTRTRTHTHTHAYRAAERPTHAFEYQVQARCTHLSMPAQPNSSVSDGPLFTSFRRRFPPASAFDQQSPTVRTTLPAQHVRPSGVFCCWPDCLELIARRPSGSGVLCWQLQWQSDSRWRHFYFYSTSVFSAEVFYVNVLHTPWSIKKQDTKLLSISSPNIDRFSKLFHWYTQQEICNKDIVTVLATP